MLEEAKQIGLIEDYKIFSIFSIYVAWNALKAIFLDKGNTKVLVMGQLVVADNFLRKAEKMWTWFQRKKQESERGRKGGKRDKKDSGLMFAVEYAWKHSKGKTSLSMWNFLKKACVGDMFPMKERADLIFESKENKLYHYHPDGKFRKIGFRAFQEYVTDFKKNRR